VALVSSNPNRQSLWKLLLALLCIALVIVCGTIQAVHVHSTGDISHADCSLCATAHVAVQVVAPVVTLVVTPVVSKVEAFVAPLRIRTVSTFALFTRPPPVDAISA
jgi:membrane protein YdbS with pleckstrin-like domain